MDWFKEITDENLWVVQVFVVVFVALLINLIQKRVLNRLHKTLLRTENVWDDALIDAARRPLAALIWIIGIAFAAEIVQQKTQAIIFSAIGPLRDVGVITCLTWFLLRLTHAVENNVLRRHAESDRNNRGRHRQAGALVIYHHRRVGHPANPGF